ncbi:MAG TPA: thioredoxin family protein [Candidatus Nanopelagicales bacterium]
MEGVLILVVVLGAATAFGLWRQRTDGRMRHVEPAPLAPAPDLPEDPMAADDVSEPLVVDGRPIEAADHSVTPAAHRLTAEELGTPLGQRATLVQFSSAFCQPCRATRVVLGDVAGMVEGVAHVEVDAESHLDLVRRLDVTRTPTVLVLDHLGRIRKRATGAPRRADVIAALGELV